MINVLLFWGKLYVVRLFCEKEGNGELYGIGCATRGRMEIFTCTRFLPYMDKIVNTWDGLGFMLFLDVNRGSLQSCIYSIYKGKEQLGK